MCPCEVINCWHVHVFLFNIILKTYQGALVIVLNCFDWQVFVCVSFWLTRVSVCRCSVFVLDLIWNALREVSIIIEFHSSIYITTVQFFWSMDANKFRGVPRRGKDVPHRPSK